MLDSLLKEISDIKMSEDNVNSDSRNNVPDFEQSDLSTLENPITDANLAEFKKACEGKNRVIAGYSHNSDKQKKLSTIILHLDPMADAKLHKVWDDYKADPDKNQLPEEMELYNVKKFKHFLVILVGPTTAVEAAKKAGLKTHPTTRVFEDHTPLISDPAVDQPDPTTRDKVNEKLPSKEPEPYKNNINQASPSKRPDPEHTPQKVFKSATAEDLLKHLPK